ncbi:uncharacterized protein K452DRAFT_309946 [Aplosporella prunicola CBS 121167]|uniref:Integral membrane protein TmpA n=1 Tax=Aplosporella prunicola CBS 121167 TaxID=1176127 RepID=A0A6A6B9C3_9PEZI|nr:uncharacterized protein K452DRAFT_309946 [Aplosporella prunicola CBS 121167]KAF2140158.1 hypothetical protein K452DRAFT_309946 [Aplosporella prunicola CBS 121167]
MRAMERLNDLSISGRRTIQFPLPSHRATFGEPVVRESITVLHKFANLAEVVQTRPPVNESSITLSEVDEKTDNTIDSSSDTASIASTIVDKEDSFALDSNDDSLPSDYDDSSISSDYKRGSFSSDHKSSHFDPECKNESFASDYKHRSIASTITPYDDYEINELPPLPYYGWLSARNNYRLHEVYYKWFSVYRQIFMVLFAFNLLGLCLFWAFQSCVNTGKDVSDPRNLASYQQLTAVAANLLVSIAFRNEHVVNVLFDTVRSLPLWLPLNIRCAAAKIYHYGGVHSSCAVAATMWYLVYAITLTAEFTRGEQKSVMVGLAWSVLTLMMLILVLAYPTIRNKYHNYFECVHRFVGWTSMGLFWAQMMVGIVLVAKATDRSTSSVLVRTPCFWILVLATVLIIYPWLNLRRRKIEAEPLSAHAIRLHFDYGNFRLCSGIRLTDRPLLETHSFATIPRSDGKPGFEVIISKAGDWTAKIIKNPPTAIWVRGVPIRGVLGIAQIFSPVVIVCTGSGIGPCLSFLRGKPNHNFHLVWGTRDPERTYQPPTLDEVFQHDPQAVILDSTKIGRRPDMTLEAYKAYKRFNAQAIVVISNPKGTKDIVFDMEARGIPAFGPIWDS